MSVRGAIRADTATENLDSLHLAFVLKDTFSRAGSNHWVFAITASAYSIFILI